MAKSFKRVNFSTLQSICSDRTFNYKGSSGRFDVSCKGQGCYNNSCDISKCPKMKVIGGFKPVSFDELQSVCANRKFKHIKEDNYYVSCSNQVDDNNNRCNHRQCPVWAKCIPVDQEPIKDIESDDPFKRVFGISSIIKHNNFVVESYGHGLPKTSCIDSVSDETIEAIHESVFELKPNEELEFHKKPFLSLRAVNNKLKR